jgi:hypothetical protein
MRIYEVKNASGKTVNFARSFDQARAVVREDSPTAKKVHSSGEMTEFSSCFTINGIDIKPDKEGILSKLNTLLGEEPSQSSQPEPQPVQEVAAPVSQKATNAAEVGCPGIVPAIAYNGTGQGTCLHCMKQVGYVGGFPRVDPPAAICD